jgi:hypothetical protein
MNGAIVFIISLDIKTKRNLRFFNNYKIQILSQPVNEEIKLSSCDKNKMY